MLKAMLYIFLPVFLPVVGDCCCCRLLSRVKKSCMLWGSVAATSLHIFAKSWSALLPGSASNIKALLLPMGRVIFSFSNCFDF